MASKSYSRNQGTHSEDVSELCDQLTAAFGSVFGQVAAALTRLTELTARTVRPADVEPVGQIDTEGVQEL